MRRHLFFSFIKNTSFRWIIKKERRSYEIEIQKEIDKCFRADFYADIMNTTLLAQLSPSTEKAFCEHNSTRNTRLT